MWKSYLGDVSSDRESEGDLGLLASGRILSGDWVNVGST